MVSEEHDQASFEENKQLAQNFCRLIRRSQPRAFELENIKSAIFGSRSELNAATGLPGSMPGLFAVETIEVTEPSATEQISSECNNQRSSKVQPDRLDFADHIERITVVLEPQGVDVSAMKCIGETVNRRLQHIPASFLLIEPIRLKYKDLITGLIYQAPATDQTFAQSSVDERRSPLCHH
jgi:hypothetical protein